MQIKCWGKYRTKISNDQFRDLLMFDVTIFNQKQKYFEQNNVVISASLIY